MSKIYNGEFIICFALLIILIDVPYNYNIIRINNINNIIRNLQHGIEFYILYINFIY